MRLEKRPKAPPAQPDLHVDPWPPELNRPPGERGGGGVVDPVGFEPVEHVVVAGEQDRMPAASSPRHWNQFPRVDGG